MKGNDTLIDYYAKRATEYERVYRKPERQDDLARLRRHLQEALRGHRVLELACGTGYWTEAIAVTAEQVTATDANEEVLKIARCKPVDPSRVSFGLLDAYRPDPLPGDFTAGFCAFWWSHIPLGRLESFLARFHAALRPGAKVVIADNRFVAGSSTPVSRADDSGNTFQQRQLDDGSTHEILKNFPDDSFLRETLGRFSTSVKIESFDYFWCVSYELDQA